MIATAIALLLLLVYFGGCLGNLSNSENGTNSGKTNMQTNGKNPIDKTHSDNNTTNTTNSPDDKRNDKNGSNDGTNSVDNLPNKWAIMCSICNEKYTAEGIELDYMPALEALKSLGFPDEHVIRLENLSLKKSKMIEALGYVKKNSCNFANATVVLYMVVHGSCRDEVGTNGKVLHSYIEIYAEDADKPANENGDWKSAMLYDYELKEMLADFNPGTFLFITVACQSGCMAGQDTIGKLNGLADPLFDSLGAPNRIVITASTAPLFTAGGVLGRGFWKYGLEQGGGDSAPIGNGDGKTSVEEAFYYCKIRSNVGGVITASSQPCMNDQYPADNPEGEMFL